MCKSRFIFFGRCRVLRVIDDVRANGDSTHLPGAQKSHGNLSRKSVKKAQMGEMETARRKCEGVRRVTSIVSAAFFANSQRIGRTASPVQNRPLESSCLFNNTQLSEDTRRFNLAYCINCALLINAQSQEMNFIRRGDKMPSRQNAFLTFAMGIGRNYFP